MTRMSGHEPQKDVFWFDELKNSLSDGWLLLEWLKQINALKRTNAVFSSLSNISNGICQWKNQSGTWKPVSTKTRANIERQQKRVGLFTFGRMTKGAFFYVTRYYWQKPPKLNYFRTRIYFLLWYRNEQMSKHEMLRWFCHRKYAFATLQMSWVNLFGVFLCLPNGFILCWMGTFLLTIFMSRAPFLVPVEFHSVATKCWCQGIKSKVNRDRSWECKR